MYSGLGNYNLKAQFSAAARAADEMCLIACYAPEEIPDKIAYLQNTASTCNKETNEEGMTTSSVLSTSLYKISEETNDESEVVCSNRIPTTPYARAR